MYKLTAYRYDYTPNSYTGHSTEEETREEIAIFDSLELVEKYVEGCKLKHPRNRTYWTSPRPFKAKSLLGNYSYTEIEEVLPQSELPHNPVSP